MRPQKQSLPMANTQQTQFSDPAKSANFNILAIDYYSQSGREGRARYYLEAALEISRFAQYDFYETFLLKKGAGFNPSAYCFTEGF